LLTLAMQAFGEITNRFPQHAVAGRACLNLGWGYWRIGQMADSEASFAAAAERLAEPYDEAVAVLKLGDTQFQQRKLTNAVANYSRFVTQFGEVPPVKTNLLERGLYQLVRAAVEAGDMATAEGAMDRLLKDFPLGFYTDDAVLTAGQSKGQRNPEGARTIFEAFLQKAPNARLAPEVHLALARTFQDQEKWTNAIAEYDRWLESYKEHPARVAAEYYRAWSEFQAGHDTNAIAGFTNLVARYNDPLYTPLAQLWVADYYYSQDNFFKAEENYKALFQSTNLPPSEMLYQARLMAGRSALGRQGWLDAINHFTNLTSNLDQYPVDLRIQAMFAYGDTLMTMDAPETNKLANLGRALEVFSKICNDYPTNQYVALAWGQKANCLLQWAQSSGDYDPATNAFHQVIQSPQADGTARCIASVGLGVVYEKRADLSTNSQKTLFLRDAWHRYLDVFYASPKVLREGEQCDPFWRKKAGWEAGRLAETLQEWSQAKSIYEQLQREFPVLGPRLERSLRKVQDQLNREAK
jgi:TolA-binding protein